MFRFLLVRISLMALALLGVLTITFMLTHVIPGDPARVMAGRWASEEQIQEIRERLGLNRPLFVQYFDYLKGLTNLDLGTSIVSQQPIKKELGSYLPQTIELVLAAMLINLLFGIPLGIIAAIRSGGLIDAGSRLLAVLGSAAPAFWIGMILQVLFYGMLNLLPLGGRLSILNTPPQTITGLYTIDSLLAGNFSVFLDSLVHLILPALTLGLGFIAVITRIIRSSMLTVLNRDYIRTARAKGLPEWIVIIKHSLRNAFIPALTVIGMQMGWMFGRTVLVETVFSWGGMGFWAVTSIKQNDFPVVMAVTLVISLIFMIANFLVDLSYVFLDPRIRYGDK